MLRGQKGESVPLGSSDEGERRLTKESHQRLGSLHDSELSVLATQRSLCHLDEEDARELLGREGISGTRPGPPSLLTFRASWDL